MTTPREQAKKAAKAVAEFLDSDDYPQLGISDLERRLADLILSHLWAPVHLPDPPKEKP